MELQYRQEGDYLLPMLEMDETEDVPLGRYGILREQYLEQQSNGMLDALLLEGKLQAHLLEIDRTAREREERMMEEMLKAHPAPDKATHQMEWVAHMNALKKMVEETILNELIYS